jgi:Nucleotide modification associated domain 1
MDQTTKQYSEAVQSCKDIFLKKNRDYGSSWRVLRTISIADQIFIKAQRIRTIQQKGKQRIADDIKDEFIGMVNYALIGLIQLGLGDSVIEEISPADAEKKFNDSVVHIKKIMQDKNHDYGEAWRDMSQEGFVDLILMKILRIRQILANEGKTLISEGIDANYTDIANYSLFALILIAEGKQAKS